MLNDLVLQVGHGRERVEPKEGYILMEENLRRMTRAAVCSAWL